MLPFKTELFFAEYEFTTRYTLASSDCETLSIDALCALADTSAAAVLGEVTLGYTEPQGRRALREKIAARDKLTAPDDVMVLGAPVEGIYLLCRAIATSGNVVALSPAYDALHNVARAGCELRLWHMRADDEWRLDLDALDTLVDDETRALIVNFPHNPTGYVPTRDELAHMAKIARERGALFFCDEIYRGLNNSDDAPPSAIDVCERAVVLGGLSKAHGLPGLRAGWLTLKDRALMAELMNWKNYTTICPPGPVEVLASLALDVEDALVARARHIIADNLAAAEGFFTAHDAFTWRRPRGASVALVEVDTRRLGHDSATDLCHALAQKGVLLLPGDCLGAEDRFVRVGLGRANFREGLDALARAL